MSDDRNVFIDTGAAVDAVVLTEKPKRQNKSHPTPVAERLAGADIEGFRKFYESKILHRPGSDCWHWNGIIDPSGKGVAFFEGVTIMASRLGCFLYGRDPGEGIVRPTCGCNECVNPAHMVFSTRKMQMKEDRAEKTRVRLSNPSRTKKCPACGEHKALDEFFRGITGPDKRGTYCKPCHKKRPLPKYGMSGAEIEAMRETQGNLCAICHQPETARNHHNRKELKKLAVDHDAVTGKVRGLLCSKCNMGIGLFSHDESIMLSAISYISRAKQDTDASDRRNDRSDGGRVCPVSHSGRHRHP